MVSLFIFFFPAVITLGYPTVERVTSRPVVAVDEDPDFTGSIVNVTVSLGREAVLVCPTTDLGNYKVGWLKADDQTILSLHNRLVTHNPRIGITHDNNHWSLHIRQVKEADKGCYMCQINTSVMKKQVGCVDVHVPPDIVDAGTSSDVTITEGENANLTCKAKGHPPPRVSWRREGSEQIMLRRTAKETKSVETITGENLYLTKIDRKQMGAYYCIASNDVPPAVSKRVTLNVNFAPIIKVPNQLLGAPLGTDVQLDCFAEAFPNTINYWKKNGEQVILSSPKVLIEEIKNVYKVQMKLKLKQFSKSDLGTYTCVTSNSLGTAEGIIRLYEIKIITPSSTSTTTTTTEATTSTTESGTTTTIETIREIRSTTYDQLYVTLPRYPDTLQSFNNEISGVSSRHSTSTRLMPQLLCILTLLLVRGVTIR